MGKQEVVAAFEKGPTEQELIATRKNQAEEIISAFEDFEIEDDDDFEVVADGLKEVTKISKDLEARRKSITQPINASLREFNSWFKPAQNVLSNTERVLRKKLEAYTVKKEEEARKAMEAAAEASQRGDFDAAHEASKGIVARPQVKGITVTRHWDYEIEDLDKIPRRYLTVDHSAVKIHIKNAGKDEPEPIPGIAFREKTGSIVRTK